MQKREAALAGVMGPELGPKDVVPSPLAQCANSIA